MEVKLIAHTPNPDLVVAAAARTCYTTLPLSTLMDRLDDERAAEYVEMLSGMGHESPIEHVTFTFAIEGVSRALLAQITRHRIASFSVRSQRYVSEKKFDYVIPPQIAECPEALLIYESIMETERRAYSKIVALLLEKRLEALPEEQRVDTAVIAAQGKIAQEDARYVLPNACETQMVVTMNARSLKNFFRLRCCNRAQWEIRELANRMLAEVRKVSPALFQDAGAACVTGKCSEGKMSCGKPQRVDNSMCLIGGGNNAID